METTEISREVMDRTEQTALMVKQFLSLGPIADESMFNRAAQFLSDEKRSVKEIEAELNPRIDAANRLHKDLTGWRAKLCGPHNLNIAALNRLLGDWGIRQQKAIDDARRERERLEREAREAARLAAEAAVKAEREARDAEDAARLAAEATDAGDTDTAGALLEIAESAKIAAAQAAGLVEAFDVAAQQAQEERRAVEAPATKYGGVGLRENWTAEVIDAALIPRTIDIAGVPVELMVPNTTELNKLAKSLKDKMSIPGVKAVRTFGTQTRLKYPTHTA